MATGPTTEETILLETLMTSSPENWIVSASQHLQLPHHEVGPKIAALIERHMALWLQYRTIIAIAESRARLAALQAQRQRQQDIAARYELELREVLARPALPRSTKQARATLVRLIGGREEPDPQEQPHHLGTLSDALDTMGGASFNLSKIAKEEREEAEHCDRLLGRLKREMEALDKLSKPERWKRVADQAYLDGRFGDTIRAVASLPNESSGKPTFEGVMSIVNALVPRVSSGT